MSAPPKLKRKKKVNVCPNPLFVQWLTEWRDSAAEKGIKTQYAYGKALNALKKYPLPLHSGKAAKILDNFGEKICSMLDKKLEEHLATEAESCSAALHVNDDSEDDELTSAVSTQAMLQNQSIRESNQKKKRTPTSVTRRAREYIPLHRSGPYSLILALYGNHTRQWSKGYMNKTELQDAAQPLCDTSMKMPEPGSHYTAWSSMGTLISKGYVIKEGNPARYKITESGCDLAVKLEAVDDMQELPTGQQPTPGKQHTTGQRPTTTGQRHTTASQLPRMPSFEDIVPVVQEYVAQKRYLDGRSTVAVPNYWYIDDRGREVTLKDRAAVTINDDGVGFLIKCSESSLQSCPLRYRIDKDRTAPSGFCYAYLHNDDASEVCPASKSSLSVLEKEKTDRAVNKCNKATHNYTNSKPASSSNAPFTQSSYAPSTLSSNSSVSAVPHSSDSYNRQRMDSDDLTKRAHGLEKTGSDVEPTPVFTLRPGQFDVILCVDNCETAGIGARDKGRKQVLLKELQKNGVNLDVRKLQVGDFVWVAREKGSAIPGLLQMPQRREAVLDYVVERKRMDDLCSSIQDGRFKEQKFRLKQCGLNHPIYLVEDFGSTDHMSLPAATILQAAVNTQVIDGFFVKNTRDSKESAAYLTIMTRYLNSLYSDKTVRAFRMDDMDKLKDSVDMQSHHQCCLMFQEFNESSVKNKEMTVTETFAKQLLQFSGMTEEKAYALTRIYQTPSHLIKAYDSCRLPSEQEKMLAKIKYGDSQRNMGPALSKVVYELYCSPVALR